MAERQPCVEKNCFATFEAYGAREDEVRHCNRGGPDGGHTHRWDGTRWQVIDGRLQHDRS